MGESSSCWSRAWVCTGCHLAVGGGASSKDVMPMLEIQILVGGDNVVSMLFAFPCFGNGVGGKFFLH